MSMKTKHAKLLRAAIKKGNVDEGLEQIIELIINYDVKDESLYFESAAFMLSANLGDEEE